MRRLKLPILIVRWRLTFSAQSKLNINQIYFQNTIRVTIVCWLTYKMLSIWPVEFFLAIHQLQSYSMYTLEKQQQLH